MISPENPNQEKKLENIGYNISLLFRVILYFPHFFKIDLLEFVKVQFFATLAFIVEIYCIVKMALCL